MTRKRASRWLKLGLTMPAMLGMAAGLPGTTGRFSQSTGNTTRELGRKLDEIEKLLGEGRLPEARGLLNQADVLAERLRPYGGTFSDLNEGKTVLWHVLVAKEAENKY